ncbi:HNH endonuclease [bacterium]|nr:HNH endonuclease [bacterium]
MSWRNSKDYKHGFKKFVIDRDMFCKCCGSKESLHAHHIDHATYSPELRLDPNNGVTLCKGCHSTLHNTIVGNYRKKCSRKDLINLMEARDYFNDLK